MGELLLCDQRTLHSDLLSISQPHPALQTHCPVKKKVGNSSLIRISNTILLGYNFQLDVFSGEVLKQKLNNGIKGSNRHLCLTLATSDIQTNAFVVVKGTNTEYPSCQFVQNVHQKWGNP